MGDGGRFTTEAEGAGSSCIAREVAGSIAHSWVRVWNELGRVNRLVKISVCQFEAVSGHGVTLTIDVNDIIYYVVLGCSF